ncbi:hypothetical protein ACFQJ7_10730 [Halovenus rubra]|uniref:Uncharacterized protein n=2 Tax=Halovenus rubra TaxID=869890 RepID=A0ACC7DVQ3_9EURY|nr:hypothetical protein [Halovenus rubra]
MDLDRFVEDMPDDDAPGEASVCVVAAQPDTFERCRDGFYPCPQSYPRTRKSFEFMAFYRTAPVSSITHYAQITDRVTQTRERPGPMSEDDWKTLIDPFSDAETVVVFRFGDLVPLETPVANDRNGVRGAWYCTVTDLRTTSTLSALSDRARS